MSVIKLPPLPTTRELVKLYKLTALKQLSQNFLLDHGLTDKIVKKAGNLGDAHVLEVGPGPGGLTRSIMKCLPKRLLVVEKDYRFKPTLDMLAEAYSVTKNKMDVVFDDIMSINLSNAFPEAEKHDWLDKPPNIFMIGNLPFSVSTPLIIQWLKAISEHSGPWSYGRTKMTLTFQKEVAERLVAQPCEVQRCRLSVMAQAWTYPMLRFVIPGKAFVPKPDVDVGVVSFAPLSKPRTQHDFALFEKVTRHVFSYRQKYSRRSIETLFPLDCREELTDVMFNLSDLDPTLRPYQLSVEDIDRLTTAYKYLMEKHPEIGNYNYRASRRILTEKHTMNVVVSECADTENPM